MPIEILSLYRTYQHELEELSELLLPQFHAMQRRGFLTTFGDVEGEILYMLLRERRPNVVFEVSPNAGWSTNYLLGALTQNGAGTLHSFDILAHIQGRPMEEVIRENQSLAWDQRRLVVHIGDARECVEDVPGTIDALLIDSCHTDCFAAWYTQKLFPRVRGFIHVQDIAFWDRMESSSEARFLWDWLRRERVDFSMIGELERQVRATDLRGSFAERRGLRSNSLLFENPPLPASAAPARSEGPDEFLKAAAVLLSTDRREAARLIRRAVNVTMHDPTRVNRHRILMKAAALERRLAEHAESRRTAQRAFGVVLQSDTQQRRKSMPELLLLFLRQRRFLMALRLKLLILLEPRSWGPTLRIFGRFILELVRRTFSHASSHAPT